MSAETETILVEHSRPDERLDIFLRAQFQKVSRGTIQRLIGEGHIRVNGHATKLTYKPRAGDRIDITWPEALAAEAKPEEIPLDILFEDKFLLVLNKPAGLVVHPSAGNEEHTLVNALLHHCAGQLSGIGGVARPGIVHRLDKETSGCLVVAKDDETHIALSKQFAARDVEKIYQAIVCGVLPRISGEVHAAIARHPTQRKRMAVPGDGAGRSAHTSYRVLERLRGATLVEAAIHTGRTHQIRVHFQHLGFPLVGDDTYGKKQNARLKETTDVTAERQMLHASHLAFTHPKKNKPMKFEAPLPEDFQKVLNALREPAFKDSRAQR